MTLYLYPPFLEAAYAALTADIPLPSEAFRFSIAGITCAIHTKDTTIQKEFLRLFSGSFLSPPSSAPAELTIHLCDLPQLEGCFEAPIHEIMQTRNQSIHALSEQKHLAPLPTAQQSSSLRIRRAAEGMQIIEHTFYLARSTPQGITRLACAFPMMRRVAIQSLWKLLLQQHLLRCGGALLHASGFVLDGEAHLFAGTSGSGKTTAMRHAPARARILSDELILLLPQSPPSSAIEGAVRSQADTAREAPTQADTAREAPTQADTAREAPTQADTAREAPTQADTAREAPSFRAYGTPFYGDWGKVGEEIDAPLAGIHFLRRAASATREKLGAGRCFQKLLRVLCSAYPDAKEQAALLAFAQRLMPYCDEIATPADASYLALLTPPLSQARS
jgi:hypothetical protein